MTDETLQQAKTLVTQIGALGGELELLQRTKTHAQTNNLTIDFYLNSGSNRVTLVAEDVRIVAAILEARVSERLTSAKAKFAAL